LTEAVPIDDERELAVAISARLAVREAVQDLSRSRGWHLADEHIDWVVDLAGLTSHDQSDVEWLGVYAAKAATVQRLEQLAARLGSALPADEVRARARRIVTGVSR